MRVCWKGYVNNVISWGNVAQNISKELIKQGHSVDICSTNGTDKIDNFLLPNLKEKLSNDYDLQLTYTFPANFAHYLSFGNGLKFGCWAWEFSNFLPSGIVKNHIFCDKFLAVSNFNKSIFIDNGMPEDKIEVIPHGVPDSFLESRSTYILPKKFDGHTKILINIQQAHLRKNISGALSAFGKAFSKNDDVVLILKGVFKKPEKPWDVNLQQEINKFKLRFPNHAQIHIITEYIPDISSLYRACDIYFFPTLAEAFNMTVLEALVSDMVVITPKYGGHMDFLNDSNSILSDGHMIPADIRMLYWTDYNDPRAKMASVFYPSEDSLVDNLKYAVANLTSLKSKFKLSELDKEKHLWKNVVRKLNNVVELIK